MIYRFIEPMLFTFRKLFVYYRSFVLQIFRLLVPSKNAALGRHQAFFPSDDAAFDLFASDLWTRFRDRNIVLIEVRCFLSQQHKTLARVECSHVQSLLQPLPVAESDVLLLFSAFVQFRCSAKEETEQTIDASKGKTVQFQSRF